MINQVYDQQIALHLAKVGLNVRQIKVAVMISKGLSNNEIANQLFMSPKTVKYHLTNIYKRLEITSRAHLIVYCICAIHSENCAELFKSFLRNCR